MLVAGLRLRERFELSGNGSTREEQPVFLEDDPGWADEIRSRLKGSHVFLGGVRHHAESNGTRCCIPPIS